MKEEFLYYLWQHQLFRKKDLRLVDGSHIEVIKPGFRNLNNGPDFKESLILINGIKWYGSVEMHVKASDWHMHNHHKDPHFDNVVLHVVFLSDKVILNTDQSAIPCLELKGIYQPKVYHRYMNLVENPGHIPCQQQIQSVEYIIRLSMLEAALIERLKRKADMLTSELVKTQYDWEEVTFRMLAKGMGFKTNGEGMLTLSRLIPLKYLTRLSSLFQKEALLLGVAGFLGRNNEDSYHQSLKEEYSHLKRKFKIRKEVEIQEWKFSPIRPANFPVFRIAQLAAIVHQHQNLWSLFLTSKAPKEFIGQLQISPSAYWEKHYRFGRETTVKGYKLSKSSISHFLINITAPLLVAYSRYTDELTYQDRALSFLSMLPREQNRITREWQKLNWPIASAFDSQGLNELYHEYCQKRQCLNCKIGHRLLQAES